MANQTEGRVDAHRGHQMVGGRDAMSDKTRKHELTKQIYLRINTVLNRSMIRQHRWLEQ